MIDKAKLAAALEFAREQGMKTITVDGIVLDVQKSETQETPDIDIKKLIGDISQEYSDEEILFWATPTFDELQEKKKQRQADMKLHEDLNGKS